MVELEVSLVVVLMGRLQAQEGAEVVMMTGEVMEAMRDPMDQVEEAMAWEIPWLI